MSLFRELQRRNVFRVGVAYLALSWLLIEVADTLFAIFDIPEWGVRFLVVVLALCFLPTLIISWVYEITPEGIKREQEVDRDTSITHQTGRRLDQFTIGLIVVALLFITADRFWLKPAPDHRMLTPASHAPEVAPSPGDQPGDALDSIAVLPFANRSADPNDVFFVDGIHDDLLTYISQIESIKTISRTSVMKYRDSIQSIPEIAAELDVSVILEGGVQRAGDQVRINVQLINAHTDAHIWSNIYDRQLTAANLFGIQSEIAKAIADALRANLSSNARQRIESVPTQSMDALEAYFIARQAMATRTVRDLAIAAEHFEKAVDLDPTFALAYAGQADTYLLQAAYSNLPWDEMTERSRAASERAIKLDPSLGEAYAALAKQKNFRGENEAAEKTFKKAIELNHNYAPSYQWFGEMLGRMSSRTEEALELTLKAVELDPRSAIIINDHAEVLESAGRIDEALLQYNKAIELEPRFAQGYFRIGLLHASVRGRFDEAVLAFRTAYDIDPASSQAAAEICIAYLNLADIDQSGLWRNRVEQLTGGNTWSDVTASAVFYVFQENQPEAMRYVQTLADWEPRRHMPLMFLSHQKMRAGLADEILSRFETYFPELTADEPAVEEQNLLPAVELALVLQETGSPDAARLLLEAGYDQFLALPDHWQHRFDPVEVRVLALQGQKERALTALRKAVDRGWRSDWWYYLDHDPALNSIRDDERFQAIKLEIEADMVEQLAQVRRWEAAGIIPSARALPTRKTDR